jgi:hypothetical protein
MIGAIGLLVGAFLGLFRTRRRILPENIALRQQLVALKRRHPWLRLASYDKRFWVLARRFWSGWKQALLVVSPETVVRWHRSGFALYWRRISKARRMVGRRRISKEVRDLIFRMIGGESNLGRAAYPRRVAGGAQGSPGEDSYGYERGDGARRTKAKTG